MKNARRIFAFLVAGVMAASLLFTGCAKKDEPGKGQGSSAGNAASESSTAQATQEDKTPVTFTYFTSDQAGTYSKEKMSDSKIGKMIQEATGVDIKFQYVVGDQETAVGVMVASGDYPDLIFARSLSSSKYLSAGALIPLEELIEKHAPNIKSAYGYAWNRMKDKNDGHIYMIKSNANIGDVAPVSVVGQGFGIQKQALEDLGWPKIKTVSQYFEAIKQYKDKNPKIEGGDAIGFEVLRADGWRNTIQWAVDTIAGFPNDGKAMIDPATLKVTLRETSEPLKKYLAILNKAYNQGLVDKESFVQNYDKYKEKIATGRVIGAFDFDWEVGEPAGSLIQQNKENRTYFFLPLTLDENTKLPPIPKEMPDAGEGIGISVKAQDQAERIMKFFDYLCRHETQRLISWGIEGEDYYVENGRFLKTAEQKKKTQDDPKYRADQGLDCVGAYGWPSLAGVFPDGNAVRSDRQPEVVKAGFTEWDNKYLKAYNLQVPADLLNKEAPVLKHYPIWTMQLKDGSPEKICESEMDALTQKWWPKLVLSKEADFESVWADYVKAVESLPVKEFIQAIEAEVKYRNDNW